MLEQRPRASGRDYRHHHHLIEAINIISVIIMSKTRREGRQQRTKIEAHHLEQHARRKEKKTESLISIANQGLRAMRPLR